MQSTFFLFFNREWRLIFKDMGAFIQALVFFILVCLLFPLSQAADNALLQKVGAGIIWISALLATLISSDNLFKSDYQDGCIEQWLINSRSLSAAMLAKCLAHWSATGLLLSLFSPLLCIAFRLSFDNSVLVFLSLLIGTPSLTLISAIGSALTVTLHKGEILLAIIILPLFIPILIFGTGMTYQMSENHDITSAIYALLTILSISLTLAPFAIAGALKYTIR